MRALRSAQDGRSARRLEDWAASPIIMADRSNQGLRDFFETENLQVNQPRRLSS
jgi:hypothetical protein